MRSSGQFPPLPDVPLFSPRSHRALIRVGLLGLGLLGFFLALGGTISVPVGGAISLLWPAVAVQFVLALWFGWPGVAMGTLFPIASNLLVADLITALAFTPANFIQSAMPLLLFRAFRGSVFLRRPRDVALLAAASVVASTAAAIVGVSLRQMFAPAPSADPLFLVASWALSNSLCGFALSLPLLWWLSPALWEVRQIQSAGRNLAFGFHVIGAVFTLAGSAVVVAIVIHTLDVLHISFPKHSLAGILGVLLLPVAAFGIHLLWKVLALPLERLVRDTQQALERPFPKTSEYPEPAELSLLRSRFSEVVTALKEQERRFRDLFETVGEPLLLVDTRGQLVDANPAFERVFAVPLARAKGRNLLSFVDFRERGQIKAILASEPPDQPVTVRTRVRIAGKGSRQVHMTATPWRDAVGSFAGFCVVATDITREEEAEQREQLASRLASLQNLLAGLAHEGNNTLQAATSCLENLSREKPDLASNLAPLWDVVERGHAMVRRVALMSGAHRYLRQETFSSAELLVGIAAASSLYPESVVSLHPAARYPIIRGDRNLLRQAVEAVVRNAFEASSNGKSVEIRFFEVEVPGIPEAPALAPGTYLVVEVRDQGQGIRREHVSQIFDPFFTTKDRASHQGVGLTLARAAATHAGGTVTVVSFPGEGTQVRLWLPVAEAIPRAQEPPRSARSRVLLVDDDTQVRVGLEQVLSGLGFQVVAAADGRHALHILREGHPPDVVILDLLMPEVSGFEVLQVVRREMPDLPVVLSSGFAPDERVQEALRHPRTFYLQKPYTLKQLEEVLGKALTNPPEAKTGIS